MQQKTKIQDSYRQASKIYDAQMTWAKLYCKIVWGFQDTAYTTELLHWLPDAFGGKILDVPVGTGVLTCPKYARMKDAQITCLDYSADMMALARARFRTAGIENVQFLQGDVGNLPFADESFDIVLSMNGFHAFPDKDAAFREIKRVLKKGGSFIGCFYIAGETKRTDFCIRRFYVPKGYFTPPFMTKAELSQKLRALYGKCELHSIGSIAYFICEKETG